MFQLKTAVIGTGNMERNHVRVYSEVPAVQLVAISDLDEALGSNLSNEFNVKYYKDYKEMVDLEKPDIVSICVSTSLHS